MNVKNLYDIVFKRFCTLCYSSEMECIIQLGWYWKEVSQNIDRVYSIETITVGADILMNFLINFVRVCLSITFDGYLNLINFNLDWSTSFFLLKSYEIKIFNGYYLSVRSSDINNFLVFFFHQKRHYISINELPTIYNFELFNNSSDIYFVVDIDLSYLEN